MKLRQKIDKIIQKYTNNTKIYIQLAQYAVLFFIL